MAIEVRAARLDDIDVLGEIELDADQRFVGTSHAELAGETIPHDVLARAVGRRRVFVACVDGVVVGFVLLTRSENELCLGQISVRRSAGRRGVGTRLLGFVIEQARANAERSIVLNTQSEIAWHQPWYERHGFRVVPEADWTPDMHAIAHEQTGAGLDWATRVHMRLDLGGA